MDLKKTKATFIYGIPDELLQIAWKLADEYNKKLDTEAEVSGNVLEHPFEDQIKHD